MDRNQAIELIKRATVYTDEEREALELLIPELAESEDEKIMRTIDDVLHLDNNEIRDLLESRNLTYTQVWDYLEKQKDASYAIEAVDRIDKYIDEHLANAHDMKDSNPDKKYYRGWDDALGEMAGILQGVYSEEKPKEQKPVDYDHEMWKNCEANFEGGKKEVIEHPEKYGLQKEQKPAWSEEDEKDVAHIIRILDDCYAYGRHDLSKTDHENLVNKLKSLRPQPKAEWSEEDEKILHGIEQCVYDNVANIGTMNKVRYIDWLKSLPLNLKKKNEDMAKLCSNEWSEEDERMFSRCVKSIESSKQFADSDTFKKAKDNEIDWLENRVKRICPPYKEQWRPTKEQLDAVRWLLDKYKPWLISSADARKKLRSLLNDLEKNYGL